MEEEGDVDVQPRTRAGGSRDVFATRAASSLAELLGKLAEFGHCERVQPVGALPRKFLKRRTRSKSFVLL